MNIAINTITRKENMNFMGRDIPKSIFRSVTSLMKSQDRVSFSINQLHVGLNYKKNTMEVCFFEASGKSHKSEYPIPTTAENFLRNILRGSTNKEVIVKQMQIRWKQIAHLYY